MCLPVSKNDFSCINDFDSGSHSWKVFSRKVIHRSWSFTEELVVAVFVLITLLAAALACPEREELVSLNLVTERLPKKTKKPIAILVTVLSVIFTMILFYYGMDKVLNTACKWKTYIRIKLAGMDFLVLCTDWCRLHDSSFY